MEMVEFAVPAVPPTINQLMRKHWRWKESQKKLWQQEIHAAIYGDKLRQLREWAKNKIKLRVTIFVFHSKPYDPDNLKSAAKIPLDVMVKNLECLAGDAEKNIDLDVAQEIVKGKGWTRFFFVALDSHPVQPS